MTNLYDTTRTLLNNRSRKLTLEIIKSKTGLSVPWLSRLAANELKNPSYFRLETLYNYLSAKKAEFDAEESV